MSNKNKGWRRGTSTFGQVHFWLENGIGLKIYHVHRDDGKRYFEVGRSDPMRFASLAEAKAHVLTLTGLVRSLRADKIEAIKEAQ